MEGEIATNDVHEDDPLFFYVDDLAQAIELAALEDESGSAVQWMAPLTFRLRHVLNYRRLRSIVATEDGEDLSGYLIATFHRTRSRSSICLWSPPRLGASSWPW